MFFWDMKEKKFYLATTLQNKSYKKCLYEGRGVSGNCRKQFLNATLIDWLLNRVFAGSGSISSTCVLKDSLIVIIKRVYTKGTVFMNPA